MITLKEFLKETLAQIAGAIDEFEASEGSASARPEMSVSGELAGKTSSSAGLLYLGRPHGYATVVNFDVAITSEESEASQIGGGIKVIPFRAEADTSSAAANTTVSRVRFAIPLKLE